MAGSHSYSMPLLPSRGSAMGEEDQFKREGPEQLISKLHIHLEKGRWRKLKHLLPLLKFMAHCQASLASHLAQAGGLSTLLGVIQGVLHARLTPHTTELLISAAVSLLSTIALSDLSRATHTMVSLQSQPSADNNSSICVLLQVMRDPHSGAQARREAARLLRCLVDAGHQLDLLTHGLLEQLPSVLDNPTTACDHAFLEDVLWVCQALVDREVASQGQLQHPQPLLRVLMPLLYVLQGAHNPHERHLLAAVLRLLHVLAVTESSSAKECLQQMGFVDSLVHVICSHQLVSQPTTTSDRSGADSSSSAATGDEQASHGSSDAHSASHGSSHAASASPSSKPVVRLPDGLDSWRFMCAAALLRPILAPLQAMRCSQHCSQQGVSGSISSVGVTADGSAVRTQHENSSNSIGSTAGSNGEVAEGCEAQSQGMGVSVYAVCIYGLLLPLQATDSSPSEPALTKPQLCPVKEAFKGLLVMLCADDAGAQWLNDHIIVRAGPALVHLVAAGDMELAWQAANTLGHLASSPHSTSLLQHGVVEELTYFLQESADALHALTVKRQLEEHSVCGTSTGQLPIPHSAYAYQGREPAKRGKGRVRLVGRQRVTVNKSWCMYGSHAPTSMCDYCVPSACLRALLRLLSLPDMSNASSLTATSNGITGQQQGMSISQDVASRFTAAGGLYALFLLLHHELCGVHPSKMASSLLTLLNMVLDTSPVYKDEVRKVGGLGLLTALMNSLARSDRVTDIFQLRVRICCSLQHVMEGNQANKLIAREHGLLDPLVATLKHATCPDAAQMSVLDDAEQVTVSTLDLLATTVEDSQGNMAAFIASGGLPVLHDLVVKPNISPSVLLAAVHVYELLVQGNEPARLAMLGTTALPRLVALACAAPASLLAQHVVALSCRLVSVHAQGKAKCVAAGVLPLLLKMLNCSPYGAHTGAASQGLYAVTLGDVDLQNEVAAQGGFHAIETLIRNSPLLCSHALWLLCCLMYGNSYMKNEARQAGFPRLLMNLAYAHGIAHPEITVPALHALAQMCQSNSLNQRAVVEEGGMSLVCSFMQLILESEEGAGGTAAAQGGVARAMMHPAVLDAVVRLLGALIEFNAHNQALVRESGCLARVADLIMLVAEVHDLETLRGAQLFPAVSAACAAVARAAQDCEANQLWLVRRHEDLAAALFRLLSIDEPYVALDASRALEYVAIRSDQTTSAGEDRAEFEADAVRAIVRLMHTRGHSPLHVPSASAAAAAALLRGGSGGSKRSGSLQGAGSNGVQDSGPPKPQATSYAVQEAARILSSILTAVRTPSINNTNNNTNGTSASTPPHTPSAPPKKTGGLLRGFTRAGRKAAAATAQPVTQPAAAAAAAAGPPNSTATGTAQVGAAPHPAKANNNKNTLAPETESSSSRAGSPSSQGPSLVSLSSLSALQGAGPHGWALGQRNSQGGTAAPSEQQQQLAQTGQQQSGAAGLEPHGAHSQNGVTQQSQQTSTINANGSSGSSLRSVDVWTQRSGCSPTAFQAVAVQVGGGHWHYVKLQLAWVLFLLAAKSPANQALIEHLTRTVVVPLAQQLANEEAFYASEEAFTALTMQASGDGLPAPLPLSTVASDKQQQQQQQQQGHNTNTNPSAWQQQQQQHHQPLPSRVSNGVTTVMPSAPDPNPLQQLPMRSAEIHRRELSVHSMHSRSGSAGSGVGGSGVLARAVSSGSGLGEVQQGSVGEAGGSADDLGRAAVAEADDETDEMRMIEAEVAMLSSLGSVTSAPAPVVGQPS